MTTNIVIDQPRSAAENMTLDEELFQQAEAGRLTGMHIRFYSWAKPAISFGYRQDLTTVDQIKAKALGIELVSRVTGGGMVFHQPNELTYCLVAENSLFPASIIQSCNDISRKIISGLQQIGIQAVLAGRVGAEVCNDALCFSRPTKYEILVNNRKLVGSAQKRGRQSFMQHGSIALEPLNAIFGELLDISGVQKQQISVFDILHEKLQYRDLAKVISVTFKK